MPDALIPGVPLWQIILRGTVVYIATTAILRLIPKRQTGNVSPNDLIALVIVGALAADAILGETRKVLDILLMVGVVLMLDYLCNLLQYRFPRFRHISQDSPTLLIYAGHVLERNLRREQLTIAELRASLRKQGIESVEQVKQAVLEVDGHISVIQKDAHDAAGARH